MENRKLFTSKQMTARIIARWLLWEFLIVIFIKPSKLISTKNSGSLVIVAIVTFLCILIPLMLAIKSAFKTKTIDKDDSPKVFRNITIYALICFIILAIINYADANKNINEALENSIEYKLWEQRANTYSYLVPEIKEKYDKSKEELMIKLKDEYIKTLTTYEIIRIVSYVIALIIAKKMIDKRSSTIEEAQEQ